MAVGSQGRVTKVIGARTLSLLRYDSFVDVPGPGPVSGSVAFFGTVSDDAPSPTSATIEVTSNDFYSPFTLVLGDCRLTLGADFSLGADKDLTATEIAEAIDALPLFTATDDGAGTISLEGPPGLWGNYLPFRVEGVAPLTLSPDGGSLSPGSPSLSGPELV